MYEIWYVLRPVTDHSTICFPVDLDRVAYFFDYRMEQTVSDDAHEESRGLVEEFCRLGLRLTEDGKYLSLALPVNPNW